MRSPGEVVGAPFVPVASAERASPEIVRAQCQLLSTPVFNQRLFESLPQPAAIVNAERQIVFCNQALLELAGANDMEEVCGQRLGEALHCVHAEETEHGCGTTESCTVCGAVQATLSGQLGRGYSGECRIRRRTDGREQAFDLEVTAIPIDIEGQGFTIVHLADTSERMRRLALERVFAADVLGLLREIQTLSASFDPSASPEEQRQILNAITSSSKLIESAITPYTQLDAAERGTLQVQAREVSSLALLEDLVGYYRTHPVVAGRWVKIGPQAENIRFTCDPALLGRVLGNMIENALEASSLGETVTVGCRRSGGSLKFHVHNSSLIPREEQLQVFQRSFTTRGKGRGLGTYMMKLIAERYLRGGIAFDSSAAGGTTFEATLPLPTTDA